jgi:hypothetical protein
MHRALKAAGVRNGIRVSYNLENNIRALATGANNIRAHATRLNNNIRGTALCGNTRMRRTATLKHMLCHSGALKHMLSTHWVI